MQRHALAASIIQALVRGVLGRKKHKQNLPNLRKALKQRLYCVECEAKLGTRRCRQCKDRYCNDCYDRVHSKGNRKKHNYENIRLDQRTIIDGIDDDINRNNPRSVLSSLNIEDSALAKKKAAKKDWEEFYDPSAKAKYWFNKVTGEASWVSPF